MPLLAIGARLRAICLALPEANEELMRRGPSYRVADKIFALERPWDDWRALWCKVPEGLREILLQAEPTRFFIPPYFGAKGWIGVGLDGKADWGAKSRLSCAAATGWSHPSDLPSSWRVTRARGPGRIASAARSILASPATGLC